MIIAHAREELDNLRVLRPADEHPQRDDQRRHYHRPSDADHLFDTATKYAQYYIAAARRPRRWLSPAPASKCRSIAGGGRGSPGSRGRHGRHRAVDGNQSVVGRQESSLARTAVATVSLHGHHARE